MAITDAQVKAVINTSITDCSPFINAAQAIVDSVLVGKGLSPSLLEQITIYLAAHFLALKEENGGLRRSRLGEADESYKTPGDKDTGLAFTRFGQQAMMMDITGTLAGLSANKGLKALFEVVSPVDGPYLHEF